MTTYNPPVLATRILPNTRAATVVAVIGFALLTALAAQYVIPLPFTPVPITGQTLVVLLAGGVLGSRRGAASMTLYLAMGAVGLPFFAQASGGWEVVTGATGGYIVGFIAAAWFVGFLAERRQDRAIATSIPAFLTGNAIIYLFGVTWLSYSLNMSAADALAAGLAPFVIGDAFKVALAGLALPATWKLFSGNK
ncbi:MAG: biotin transporter BioY [Acidimicrobiia bacterium]|nr:biotin transporter BioY [Acidimicrobiia bacterium]